MLKRIFFLSLLLTIPVRSKALELSLEENKGESGTVGYVDIDRVFKEYSGTLNAREEFLGEIKKKEGAVNQRKHAIYILKADIAKLRQEREFALTLPSIFATEEQISSAQSPPPPHTAAPAAPSEGAVAAKSSGTVPVSTAASVNASTAAVVALSTAILPANLPGMGEDLSGASKIPANYFKFSVSTAVPEIDAAIASKETDLKQKEDALKLYQRQVEKELLEYESHRSEILLGRIYIALKELAVREEVSVIMDKRNILFGHSAVDLTDKLLKHLEETQ